MAIAVFIGVRRHDMELPWKKHSGAGKRVFPKSSFTVLNIHKSLGVSLWHLRRYIDVYHGYGSIDQISLLENWSFLKGYNVYGKYQKE